MSKQRIIILFITMLFCVSAQNSITVTGTVRDKLTHPVEGITVAYQCDGTDIILPVQTDESGYFEFSFEQLGIDNNTLPNTISLGANYPNPFNPGTVIPLTTNTPGQFLIHDLLGRRVQSIQITHAGHFTLAWGGMLNSGLPAPAGIYFYSFQTVESRLTGKMILLDGGGNTGLSLTGGNKTKQQRQSKQVTECGNYTLSYSAEHITDITIDLGETGYTEDTEITQEVNITPHGTDQSYSVHIGDTLLIDLNDVIDNDSPTVFEIEENNHFIELESDILQYIPNEPETFSIEVTAIDSMDTALMDTIIINTEAVYWDTTSHVFTWEIDTVGLQQSMILSVDIIDENDFLIGGIIYPQAYTGDPPDEYYNFARWDGEDYELSCVMGEMYCGQWIRAIKYFDDDDIWVGGSCFPYHWDGIEWTMYDLEDMGLEVCVAEDIWGTSSENIYFVGRRGIVHYDGNEFTDVGNGIDVKLTDIDGTPDGEHLFVRGFDMFTPSRTIILEYHGTQWDTLYYIENQYWPEEGDYGHIYGIGVFGDTLYVDTVPGLWKYNYLDSTSLLIPHSVTQMGEVAARDIHINNPNDIFFDGAGFKLIHYNGATYYTNSEIYDMYAPTPNYASCYTGDFGVVVGNISTFIRPGLVVRWYHE